MKKRGICLAVLLCLACSSALADETVTLTLGGDCVLGTREEWIGQEGNFDDYVAKRGFDWCFSGVREVFAQDDMTLINLECVLQDGSKGHNNRKQHTFRGKPDYAQMLVDASVEQVNIANNHYIDYNQSGQKSTKAALNAVSLPFSGYRNLYMCEINGHKLGFGGCRETEFLQNKAIVYRDIQKLRKQGCEVVIYSCHWGREYSATHSQKQERMAQYAINSSADIIVGTHPHVVQGVESRDNAVVLYSLGNLVFGGTHEMTTFDAMLARVTLRFADEGGAYLGADVDLLPVLTSGSAPANDFRPVLAEGADRERILQKVRDDSPLDVSVTMWFPRKAEPND